MLFYLTLPLSAQEYRPMDVSIEKDGKLLNLATIGGLVAPQFSSIDLNGDGVLDLFVFDRIGNIVRTFVHSGEEGSLSYRYAPEYQGSFPKLTEFALLRDFNGDGKMDIFTLSSHGVNGIEVWKNTSTGTGLSFTQVENPGKPFNILYYQLSSGSEAPVYSSNIDVPAIEDIDNDGDLDILTFGQSENKVQFFKNYSAELGGGAGKEFVYRKESSCYGLMYESAFSQQMFLSEDGITCAEEGTRSERTPLHAGSTITVLDANRDGAIDLLIGDLTSPNLVYLENGHTTHEAWMHKKDEKFPSYNVPVELPYFPSTYYIDVNNDGKKDLIACPNNNLSSENVNHIWLYLNKGIDKDSFVLEKKDFLIGESLSYGTISDFAFVDYNADGLMDLLMGTDAVVQNQMKSNALILLKNIGTPQVPRYQIEDEDYLSMSALGNNNRRLSPAAGDLDGDGDVDILIGNSEGILYYFENTAGVGKPIELANYQYTFMNIDPGLWNKPMIYDLNKDGLGDIICGEKNDNAEDGVIGSVNYFENIGTRGNPMFNPDPKHGNNTSVLGGMFTKDIGVTSTGSASPFFINTHSGTMAVVGSRSGKIRVYTDIDKDVYGRYTKHLDSIPLPLQGDMATVALADIDGDMYYEMVVGNERGGIVFFDTPILLDSTDSVEDIRSGAISISPNPTHDIIHVSSVDARIESLEVFAIDGKRLFSVRGSTLDLSGYDSGVYLVRIHMKNNTVYTKRVVKY